MASGRPDGKATVDASPTDTDSHLWPPELASLADKYTVVARDQVRARLKAAEGHRLYPLYVVAATMGLRRGELLGVRWSDLDLDSRTLTIEQTVQRAGGKLVLSDAKTESSESPLPLPEWTWLVLPEHQEAQRAERKRLAAVWQDQGLVFPSEVGAPMEPAQPESSFRQPASNSRPSVGPASRHAPHGGLDAN